MAKQIKPVQVSFQFIVQEVNGSKAIVLNSPLHYKQWINSKTKVGEKGTITLSFKKLPRSQSQLNYYWVLVGYLAEYTGFTDDEIHEALMKLKFGTKKVKIGSETVEVRKSISSNARFPLVDMIELIDFAREKCLDLDIHVPSAQELGYITN